MPPVPWIAPPNTYRKISRNIAPWIVPSTTSWGVRRNFRIPRRAMAVVLAPSPVDRLPDRGRVSTTVDISFPPSLSSCFLIRRFGGTPRQREEHLVPRRRPTRHVVGRDARGVERTEDLSERVRSGLDPNADPTRRLVDL